MSVKSFESMKLCVGQAADVIANVLGYKGPGIVYKWTQDPLQSGTRNPADVLEAIIQVSIDLGRSREEALSPLRYLQSRFSEDNSVTAPLLETYAELIQEFSHLMREFSAATADGRISPDERRRLFREVTHIRQALDDLERVLNGLGDKL